MARLLVPLVLAIALVPVTAEAQAPSGFRTHVDQLSGLQVYAPKSYVEIPQQPTEYVIRALWESAKVPRELLRRGQRGAKPRIGMFLFRKGSTGVTGAREGEKDPSTEEPTSLKELMKRNSAVRNLEEFGKKKLRGWRMEAVKGKEGQFDLKTGNRGAKVDPRAVVRQGYLVMKEERGYVFGLYGMTWSPHFKKLKSDMVKMFRGLELPDAKKALAEREMEERRIRARYRGKKYPAIERRVQVRLQLAKGWSASDTENYIIVYKTRNDRLIKRIGKDIEAMRDYYEQLFPPAGPIDAVSVVRICPDLEEYHAYGGPRGSGGFWNFVNEELVLFDYSQERKEAEKRGDQRRRLIGNKDSMLVLKHEAFHQYIFYAVGEVSPHDWFNEGHGDFFSGAVTSNSSSKVLRIEPSSWRIDRARDQFETGKGRIPVKVLLRADRRLYYGPRKGDFYAAGWSFVYFMRTDPNVLENPKWAGLLDMYFNTLKDTYRSEIAKYGDKPTVGEKRSAANASKQVAIDKALEGVDLDALDKAWERYTISLKTWDPKKGR